ncbi:MAG: 50S ribosomal protein L24, partial [Ignavibacteriae bacterium]|nr:50S ribosomal protein L24 [Ignavibacteriota bacterium]
NVSNVMIICPKCGKQTRIGHKSVQDTISARKKTMRICRKCEEMF